ncbi:hypothetical protein MHAS_00517 [Mycolicibacterium hassiacum DSM 44199]|nr:hypothetical protein MHAS_00517 [Mycolicibacterium hassiacum DSM 44199]
MVSSCPIIRTRRRMATRFSRAQRQRSGSADMPAPTRERPRRTRAAAPDRPPDRALPNSCWDPTAVQLHSSVSLRPDRTADRQLRAQQPIVDHVAVASNSAIDCPDCRCVTPARRQHPCVEELRVGRTCIRVRGHLGHCHGFAKTPLAEQNARIEFHRPLIDGNYPERGVDCLARSGVIGERVQQLRIADQQLGVVRFACDRRPKSLDGPPVLVAGISLLGNGAT